MIDFNDLFDIESSSSYSKLFHLLKFNSNVGIQMNQDKVIVRLRFFDGVLCQSKVFIISTSTIIGYKIESGLSQIIKKTIWHQIFGANCFCLNIVSFTFHLTAWYYEMLKRIYTKNDVKWQNSVFKIVFDVWSHNL